MCDRLVAGNNNLSRQRKLLEKKDLTFAEARKIYEQLDDLMKAKSSEAVTIFQRQKTPANQPPRPNVHQSRRKIPQVMKNESIHAYLVEFTTYAPIAAFVMPNVISAGKHLSVDFSKCSASKSER
ncbi:unnamed protein product [Echinostoma caproni]|uniref:Transposase n=1 Tax=Echinostoma caproni TaxID=27848 RepID=A0A183B9F4_9TREM|nr:unnamed protein product [Echinostoma caproni]